MLEVDLISINFYEENYLALNLKIPDSSWRQVDISIWYSYSNF